MVVGKRGKTSTLPSSGKDARVVDTTTIVTTPLEEKPEHISTVQGADQHQFSAVTLLEQTSTVQEANMQQISTVLEVDQQQISLLLAALTNEQATYLDTTPNEPSYRWKPLPLLL